MAATGQRGDAARRPAAVALAMHLADASLDLEAGIFALFGLPALVAPTRAAALAVYDKGSRVAMERLRAHAIRHRRGFTSTRCSVPPTAPRLAGCASSPRP
ncbi:hypothetical protein AB5I41_31890 [Sphingomonas sp. MMS24-JH45]